MQHAEILIHTATSCYWQCAASLLSQKPQGGEMELGYAALKSTSVSVCFRGISRLPSAFVFLR